MTSIVILIAFLATNSATDIFLPSLPELVNHFASSTEALQMSISIYLLAALLAAPFWGTLSDHYGRRKIFFWGLSLFALGSLMCMLSTSLPMLLIARFIQGSSSITVPIVGWATITDIYTKDESAKVIALMGSIITLCPLLAPVLGGCVDAVLGWRINFLLIFLIALSSLLLVSRCQFEKTRTEKKGRLKLHNTFSDYASILKNWSFLNYVLMYAILCAGELAYLTIAPFYLETTLHLKADKIGMYISCAAIAYVVGSLVNRNIIKSLGIMGALAMGVSLTLVGGAMMLAIHFFLEHSLVLFVVSASLYLFGMSLVWGPSTSGALHKISSQKRGSASAMRSIFFTGFQSLGAALSGRLDSSSLLPLAFIFLATGICAAIAFVFARNEERRLNLDVST